MRRSGWFERRLLLALVLFSLIPTLLLVGVGTLLLREAVSLQTTPAGWERLAESGQALLEQAEASGDSSLLAASALHREELRVSVQQAQRWGYLNRRVLEVLPWLALAFIGALGLLAVRSARGIARELARPIHELVGWSGHVARGEPLPSQKAGDPADAGEFGALRASFRGMAAEVELSRQREIERARIHSSIALARGVAHELKNALTPLTLAVRTLQRNQSLTGAEREPLEVIDSESRRLDALARAFSQFGRPPEGPPSRIDLHEMLEYLARIHLPNHIDYRLQVEEDLPDLHGYYEPLSRAFANLLLNATEAIGDQSGCIAIEAARSGEEEVMIRISDNGPGIPEEALPRVWDPDFTTKPRGTGLGLALARQAIHAHGGHIEAGNAGTGGAEMKVTLPVGRDKAPGATETPAGQSAV